MTLICRTCGREHPDKYIGNIHYCITALCTDKEELQAKLKAAGLDKIQPASEPIHEWFALSYAQYLTVPRSILQSMPTDWQERFVGILRELDGAYDWRPADGRYWVRLRDSKGRFAADPFMDYERGRRRLTPKEVNELQRRIRMELQRLPLKAS